MTSRHRHWRPQLTQSEFYRGWVFFALYILVFPRLMGALQKALGERWQLLPAEYSLIYYLLAVTLVVLVFWSFLYNGVHILLDWLPENLFAFATGLAGAGVLKGAIGIFGMLAVLSICLTPFLQMVVQYLLYKLAAFLAGTITEGPLAGLIDALGTAFGLMLGMTGSCALLLLISITSSVSAVLP